MRALAGLCLILSCVAGFVLGVRMFWAWRRTRKGAEFSIGFTALALSLSGILLMTVAEVPFDAQSSGQQLTTFVALLLLASSSIALGLGYRIVFRPHERWALWLWGAGAVLLLAWWGLALAWGGSGLRGETGLRPALYYAGRLLLHGWGTLEAFRYRAVLRRRLALGLADPLVTHQFWLWGVSGGAVVGTLVLGAWSSYVLHQSVLTWPLGLFAMGSLGVVSAVTIWWAFYPPAFYRRLVVGSETGS